MSKPAKGESSQPPMGDEIKKTSGQFDQEVSLKGKNPTGKYMNWEADGNGEETPLFPEISPSDIVIGVMGMTGVGKSTFIDYFANDSNTPEIGHTLESCTWKVELFPCTLPDGTKLYLIDTPGFDDTHKPDTDILCEIAHWLDQAYTRQIKLTGIVYLHRIFDNRVAGSAMKNLRMFRKLCGDQGLGSVVLATTQWSRVSLEEGEQRELELKSKPSMWKTLLQKGASIRRQDKDKASAFQILQFLIERGRRTYLNIQEEMASGAKLEDTAAGSEVLEEIKQAKAKFDEEMTDLRKEMKDAITQRDREKQEEIEEMIQDFKQQQETAVENERKLAADREELRRHKEEEDRLERQRIYDNLLRQTAEIARSQAELEFLKEKHELDLDKQRSDFDAANSRAEVQRMSQEAMKYNRIEQELKTTYECIADLKNDLKKKKDKSSCLIM